MEKVPGYGGATAHTLCVNLTLRESSRSGSWPGVAVMGIVVPFPNHALARSGSAPASRGRLACMAASASKLTPTIPRASAAEITGAHHSAGRRLLKCHLRTAKSDAPVSSARVSSEGHNSQTARGVVGSDMPELLGPIVLNVKANVSYDTSSQNRENLGMADRMSETEEKLAFIGRVRSARKARYPTQKPMLLLLGIDQDLYKQYETRTPLPLRFIPKFCAATGVEMEWLLTGEGVGPKVEALPIPRKRTVKRSRSRAA